MKPRIAVIGVGGAGGNAINNMIAAGLSGPEFMVANTDSQALDASATEKRIQLGSNLTEGLGAGSKPEIGEAAAEESVEEIRSAVRGCHMVFIAAGMGGGTGTGATSVIARAAREFGILTVAVVTKPFQFEGSRRMRVAEAGIAELRKHVDTLLVIPNQNLFRIATDRTTFAEAFVLADQVLYSGIACIVDLIIKEGLINLDLADVKTVLSGMGTAMMGTGEAAGEQRAVVAAEEAIVNPLLDDTSLKGAKSLLLSITGGRGLTLWEVDEAANRVRQEVDPDANIIVGATFDDALGDKVRVSLVASGMGRLHTSMPRNGHEHAWAPRAAAPTRPAQQDFRQRLTEAIEEGAVRPAPVAPAAHAGDPRTPGSVYITEGPIQLSPLGHASRDGFRANGSDAADRLQNGAARHNGHGFAAESGDRWDEHSESAEPELQTAPPFVYQRQPESAAPRKSLLRRLTGVALGRRDEPLPSSLRPSAGGSGSGGSRERVDLPIFFGRGRR
jgi:cell division protein FtsZ